MTLRQLIQKLKEIENQEGSDLEVVLSCDFNDQCFATSVVSYSEPSVMVDEATWETPKRVVVY